MRSSLEIPFDPDFDESGSQADEGLQRRSPFMARQAFVAGFVAAVLAFGTLGFIVLLLIIFAR